MVWCDVKVVVGSVAHRGGHRGTLARPLPQEGFLSLVVSRQSSVVSRQSSVVEMSSSTTTIGGASSSQAIKRSRCVLVLEREVSVVGFPAKRFAAVVPAPRAISEATGS